MNFGYILACMALSTIAAELPSPALLVLNKDEASMSIVDPRTGKVTGKVRTGESPHEIVASADGRTAFVTNYGSQTPGNSLSVIDLIAQKETRADLRPMLKPHGIDIADGKIWFTAEGSKVIGRYDPSSNRVDEILGTGQNGTHMVLLNKEKNRIFTTNMGSDTVSIFTHAPDGVSWNQTVIAVGKGPEGLDLSPDGKELWVSQLRDGGVAIIDVEERKLKHTFDIGTKRSNRIKFTPDGKKVLVSDLAGGELLVIDVASRKTIKKLPLGKTLTGILIEPKGEMAFIAVSGDHHIAVLDLKKLEVVRKIEPGKGPDGMVWIP